MDVTPSFAFAAHSCISQDGATLLTAKGVTIAKLAVFDTPCKPLHPFLENTVRNRIQDSGSRPLQKVRTRQSLYLPAPF